MKRIICHWTGGSYKANGKDREHYHFIFQGDGSEVPGIYPIKANLKPRGSAYAAHTYRCNTGSIGLSMACMGKAVENGTNGPWPMTEAQFEAMAKKAAALCREYAIPVTSKTVLWHSEVQYNLGIKQKQKWDANILPFNGMKGREVCGSYLRERVLHHMGAAKSTVPSNGGDIPTPKPPKPAEKPVVGKTPGYLGLVRIGAYGEAVASIQTMLAALGFYTGKIDKDFGPNTENAVKAFQRSKGLEADGKVGPKTHAALFPAQPVGLASMATTKGKQMNGSKSMFASKGVWGGAIAFLAGVAGMFGYGVPADAVSGITDNITAIIAAVGGLLAAWGRITANKKIG